MDMESERLIKELYDLIIDQIKEGELKELHKSVRAALQAVQSLHTFQEITLPDGSWGVNCVECDGYSYPCNTIQVIIREIR